MATPETTVAHSSWHFEELQLSSKEFYQSVEERIQYYEYPNLKISTVSMSQGVFYAAREYLCIRFREYHLYVCAAPVGRSYFISWWLEEQLSNWTIFLSFIPFFGDTWARNSMKKTLYQKDTEDLFLQSIKKIVESMVEKVKTDKAFLNKEE
jgi:hypothetical protein